MPDFRCNPSGKIKGTTPPPGKCNPENDSDCCKAEETYTTYKCSPPVSGSTKAVLTLNSFQKDGDGGGPSECDKKYHSDDMPVVALSTGWYTGGSRCLKNIVISGNGQSVTAMVVDECDSTMGCDDDHDYQPPCPNNIVDASKAVWKALGVSEGNLSTFLDLLQKIDLYNQHISSFHFLFLLFLLVSVLIMSLTLSVDARPKTCKPSGKIKGKKHKCNTGNESDCCEDGKYYDTYKCSPPVSGKTKAVLTINGFEKGADGGGPSECDGKYHSDDTPIVALSTGWFNNMKRCFKNVTIYGNGKSVNAMVVDECDSTMGCDDEHDYQPPCDNNIVDASRAVWKALGVSGNDWGEMEIQWSDA